MNTSVELADEMVGYLHRALADGTHGLSGVPNYLKTIIAGDMWRQRVIRQTGELASFERFEQFVSAPPLAGLGTDMAMLKRMCRDDAEALDALDRAVQAPVGKHRDLHNVQVIEPPTGNTPEAALRRLRKDAPELHARVLAGEISPHGAMVEAGFRKRTMTVPVDPERAAVTLSRHFTPDELRELVSALAAMIEWRG